MKKYKNYYEGLFGSDIGDQDIHQYDPNGVYIHSKYSPGFLYNTRDTYTNDNGIHSTQHQVTPGIIPTAFGRTMGKAKNYISKRAGNAYQDTKNQIRTGMRDLGSTIKNSSKSFGNRIQAGFNDIGANVKNAASSGFNQAVDGFGQGMNAIGSGISNGISNGINSMGHGISNGLKRAGRGMYNGFTNTMTNIGNSLYGPRKGQILPKEGRSHKVIRNLAKIRRINENLYRILRKELNKSLIEGYYFNDFSKSKKIIKHISNVSKKY